MTAPADRINRTAEGAPVDLAAPSADSLYGWDWTQTTHDGRDRIVNDLLEAMRPEFCLPGGGYQGWSQSVTAYDAGGYKQGTVYFGGGRDDVHVKSTSAVADETRPLVAGFDRARTARVDTRVDTEVPFRELWAIFEEAAEAYGSRITYYESRERGESKGRTVYLGSPRSQIYVRLYEKWLESPGQYKEGTNRVEVQLRPNSKAKKTVTGWSRAQTFCASKTTQRLAQLLGDDLAPKASLHIARGTPDLERTLEVMGQQYGGAVDRWLELSRGDMDTVLDYLLAKAAEKK